MANPRGLYFKRVGNGQHSRHLNFLSAVSLVGRHESCNIRIEGQARTVSRKHCEITLEDGRLYIENKSTTTDTYLNEDRVRSEWHLLKSFYLLKPNQQVLQKTEVDVGDLIGLGKLDKFCCFSDGVIQFSS